MAKNTERPSGRDRRRASRQRNRSATRASRRSRPRVLSLAESSRLTAAMLADF